MQSCQCGDSGVGDHFADVGKMVEIGKGGQRERCETVTAIKKTGEQISPVFDESPIPYSAGSK